jgi:cytoskeleton protein RodZ
MSESMNRKQNEDRQDAGRRLHLREVSSEYDDYDGIGADLRAGRVRLGQDIPDLANILRIRSEHLLAVEQGRFADLPAPVYAVGFVRTYAEHVGLNGEDAIRRFKEEAEGLPHHTRLSFPTPEEESRVPRGWLLAVAGIVAVLVYAGWYYAENKDRLNLADVPAVPERLADKAEPVQVSQEPQIRLQAPAAAVQKPAEPIIETTEVETTEVARTEEVVTAVEPASVTPDAVVTPSTTDEMTPGGQAVEAEVAAAVEPVQVVTTQPASTETPERIDEPVATSEPAQPVTPSVTPQDVAVASTTEPVEPVGQGSGTPVASVSEQPAAEVSTPAPAQEPVAVVAEVKVATTIEQPVQQSVVTPEVVEDKVVSVAPTDDPPANPPAAQDTPTEKTDIPAATPDADRKKEAFGSPVSQSRVEIYARVDVWVQVTSQDGEALLSRILRQGDSYYAPLDQSVFLTTGNAGALQILVDGKVIQPVGPPGAVRRDVPLDPEQLIQYTSGSSPSANN